MHGNMGTKDVILVYSTPPTDIIGTPMKQVIAFKRISVDLALLHFQQKVVINLGSG